jgi:hypothetical protein
MKIRLQALAQKSLGDVQIARAILLCVNIKMRCAAHIVSVTRGPQNAQSRGRGFNGPTKEASMGGSARPADVTKRISASASRIGQGLIRRRSRSDEALLLRGRSIETKTDSRR